jgi:hypothetical protein
MCSSTVKGSAMDLGAALQKIDARIKLSIINNRGVKVA